MMRRLKCKSAAAQALADRFPGVSYLAWTWNFGYGGWSLISDANGDLSGSAYAAAVKAHYLARAKANP
jgi:hypothetical protein